MFCGGGTEASITFLRGTAGSVADSVAVEPSVESGGCVGFVVASTVGLVDSSVLCLVSDVCSVGSVLYFVESSCCSDGDGVSSAAGSVDSRRSVMVSVGFGSVDCWAVGSVVDSVALGGTAGGSVGSVTGSMDSECFMMVSVGAGCTIICSVGVGVISVESGCSVSCTADSVFNSVDCCCGIDLVGSDCANGGIADSGCVGCSVGPVVGCTGSSVGCSDGFETGSEMSCLAVGSTVGSVDS